MKSIVPLIFLLFLLPGVVYGFVAGTFKNSKDIVKAMTQSMEGMAFSSLSVGRGRVILAPVRKACKGVYFRRKLIGLRG